ncbi:MAG: dihydroorotate dehydrogenase-like protein [Pseudomonadota bacterium]|nr:dihydroorotate dehydrogenase-like protein [Pseudomonadota bacterium]
MVDLSTEYLGLKLKNPLVPSASPLSRSVGQARALEDAGASALVMYSLFEEEMRAESVDLERHLIDQAIAQAAAAGLKTNNFRYRSGLDLYLEQVTALKAALDIPVIASLNGIGMTSWVEVGRELEQAGADALELNVYYIAADASQTPETIEGRFLYLLESLREAVSLPIAMKISPYFCALPAFVQKLEASGAGGVVLFNRFFQPDIDLETLAPIDRHLLSGPAERLLAMRWIALLHGRSGLDLAGNGGVYTWQDAVKMLLAGADVVNLASALLQHGPARLGEILAGIEAWMEAKGYDSLGQFKGILGQQPGTDTSALTREGYVMMLDNYTAQADPV